MPDSQPMHGNRGNLLTAATKATAKNHFRAAICGECSPILLAQRNVEAAIRLEHL
jgi:hypothetical protein